MTENYHSCCKVIGESCCSARYPVEDPENCVLVPTGGTQRREVGQKCCSSGDIITVCE